MAPSAVFSETGGGQQIDDLEALCQIVTPVGMLGYGFEKQDFYTALDQRTLSSTPMAIILDSGSTDSGPSKLALGEMTQPRSSYKADLTTLVDAVLRYRIPLLISSAGGDGTNAHVDEIVSIIEEILEAR